jgi:hypothetical protein
VAQLSTLGRLRAMNITSYKRLTLLLTAVIVVLLGLFLCFICKFQVERVQQRSIYNTIYTFDRQRFMAVHSEPKQVVDILYSLDSSPDTNTSYYAKIYEIERVAVIRDIIIYLRQKTGADLGDDPKKWIERYDK